MKELNLGKNTALSILNKLSGVILGIFTARFLILGLSSNDYGFYVFLWKISSTLFLTDLGLGLAAQKKKQQNFLVHKKSEQYSEEISSIFFFYFFIFIVFYLNKLFLYFPLTSKFFKLEFSEKPFEYYKNTFFLLLPQLSHLIFLFLFLEKY